MESALFSPPLSKQRNEFAIQKIKEVRAKSLVCRSLLSSPFALKFEFQVSLCTVVSETFLSQVDLGCGSGSLLDAVVDTDTDLEHIAGVDISQKSLFRATKVFSMHCNHLGV